MGSYESLFEKTEHQNLRELNPSKSDWITGHADLTGPVVEVQRFWNRFRQLGCDKNGFISSATLEKGELNSDLIVRNIVANLPKDKKGRLSFSVFLNFINWLEDANTDSKLKVVFGFINNGDELDTVILTRLLKRVYQNKNEDEIKATAEYLMSQIDPENTGFVTESQFVENIKQYYTEQELSEILTYDLIPTELLESAHMQQSLPGVADFSTPNVKQDIVQGQTFELTDDILEKVAKKAINRDWEKLAIKLGFLEYDIQSYKAKHRGYNYETMLEILMQWRDQDPFLATKARLKRYLDDSNMIDASAYLK